jgi:hypothetical protein
MTNSTNQNNSFQSKAFSFTRDFLVSTTSGVASGIILNFLNSSGINIPNLYGSEIPSSLGIPPAVFFASLTLLRVMSRRKK